ncbi:hypothetical protein [Leptospira licerasiae]|uniref:hypothetical protein n=1 Tax=Leptospira licerasiae TaxID=447106 RepID=UPI000248BF41|nr:hypothetical protein [Leptospira licerasiae]EIE01466.1 hypothetical protein LEP1GSC185_3956 [Leptospira licerasiae serovar Varillal str. VAR 010]
MDSKEIQPLFFIRYDTIFEDSEKPDESELLTMAEVVDRIRELSKEQVDTSRIVIIDSGNEISPGEDPIREKRLFSLDFSRLGINPK